MDRTAASSFLPQLYTGMPMLTDGLGLSFIILGSSGFRQFSTRAARYPVDLASAPSVQISSRSGASTCALAACDHDSCWQSLLAPPHEQDTKALSPRNLAIP